MSMIIDLNLACVVCLQQNNKLVHSIFDCDEQQQSIAEKIAACSELHLSQESTNLPDKICQQCLHDLDVAWRFRQNCAAASSIFENIVKQMERTETVTTYELQPQHIRLPMCLRIKRVSHLSKTYLTPVEVIATNTQEVEQEIIDEDIMEEERLGITDDDVDGNVGNEEEVRNEVELEVEVQAEENEDEDMEEEQVVFEDYYESEQVLDEEEEHVETVEHLETIEHIKTEEFEKEAEERKSIHVQIKEESEEEMEPLKKVVKRGRGRPRKLVINNDIPEREITVLSLQNHSKFKSEPEVSKKITDNAKSFTRAKMKTKASESTKSDNLAKLKAAPTRKRSSHSPEARPAKICEICGNSYKYQHALNAHMRRHTNTRPFGCEFCEKAFVCNVELRRHMRVHTGHKPYACQYCDRRFSDFGSRIKHERTHTGDRPYACSCGKSFAYAHVLSVHMRTHTGEKKFQCQKCNRGFTKKVYLQAHMQQHVRYSQFTEDGDTQQQQEPEPTASGSDYATTKTVALEECIFTTEYIEQVEKDRAESKEERFEIGAMLEDDEEARFGVSANEDTEYIIAV